MVEAAPSERECARPSLHWLLLCHPSIKNDGPRGQHKRRREEESHSLPASQQRSTYIFPSLHPCSHFSLLYSLFNTTRQQRPSSSSSTSSTLHRLAERRASLIQRQAQIQSVLNPASIK